MANEKDDQKPTEKPAAKQWAPAGYPPGVPSQPELAAPAPSKPKPIRPAPPVATGRRRADGRPVDGRRRAGVR